MDLRDRLPRFSARSLARAPNGVSLGAILAKWTEALLLLLLVIQVARLVWALLVPMGMVGEWRARAPAPLPPGARSPLFRSFEPFTRGQVAEGPSAQVTGLALQLFGTRINEGSGLGSAIVATPDGIQSSFAVGDEIMPGVKLKDVFYDHVVIDRGGRLETLFLDQSAGGAGSGAPMQGGAPAGVPGQPGMTPPGPLPAPSAAILQRDVGFAPRSDGGRMTGLIVSPKGEGPGFAAAGFQPGDIITQVNGRPITSASDIQALQGQLRPGARISLMVERGAATVPIAVTLSGEQ
ncbi:type II secretion system protein N [soil metagenome]